jgi:putative FmdB family regulatory protein
MPTYEYECSNCSDHFDINQKISEYKLTKCLKCDKEALIRVISAGPSFHLKGEGWPSADMKNGGIHRKRYLD